MRGVFVTGTDTGVGKTLVSAALVCALRAETDVIYWKPIQTGIEEDDDTKTVRRLAGCSEEEIHDAGIRLERPLSPHLSARLAGAECSVDRALSYIDGVPSDRFWVVEGAGGALVPLNDDEMMTDLMTTLGLPAVIAARSGLGTINHTLLTVECLRSRGIGLAGVVMNGEANRENRLAIESRSGVEVIGEMPLFYDLDEKSIKGWAARALRINGLLTIE